LQTEKFLDIQVRRLSLGERMKMELIGAILHVPKVLLLDEPTIGLDIIAKQRIRTFLRNIQKTLGITILLTSHDMDDIEQVCDRVIVINNGEKVYDDALTMLTSKYQQYKFLTLYFNEKPNQEAIPSYVNEIISEDERSYTLKVDSHELSRVISDISKDHDLSDIDIISTPLEEIIRDIFE